MLTSAYSEPTIETYLSQLPSYRVSLVEERGPSPESGPSLSVEAALLDEYVMYSYSRWDLQPVDSPFSGFSLDVYEMLDPWGAYGLFSIWPRISPPFPGRRLELSVDNSFHDNSLVFWRGSYFFHLKAENSEPQEEALHHAAGELLERMDLLNLHPLTVILLPRQNLLRDTIRYYLGSASFQLSAHFPASLKPHLGLDRDIEITEARYLPGESVLFLIGYPTPELAAHFYLELQKAMTSYFSTDGVYTKRTGVVVGVFFGPEEQARSLLDKVQYAPTIKWLYRDEPLPGGLKNTISSFLGVVRRTLFLLVGFLLISLGGGFALGLLRYETFRRFSKRLFREDLVFIKLD